MKAATAIFAGVCLIAVGAFAQPKEPAAKEPLAAKLPANAEKALTVASPIEGFALANISAFEVGEHKTSCGIDRKRRELTMKTTVLPSKSGAYGGCCYEHTEALALDADVTVAATLSISHSEAMVHVNVEQSSGMAQRFLHRGPLDAGSHKLVAPSANLNEVRRVCVAVFGGSEAAHETSLRIKHVTFDVMPTLKTTVASAGR
jgi:hypothetical protein